MAGGHDVKVVLQRTDLPKNQRQPIQEAVRLLWLHTVKKNENDKKRTKTVRWSEFARALRASLDKSFQPHWHVLVGSDLGFACKKQNNTMGQWRVDDTSVVIWKSPGIEPPAPMPESSGTGAAGGPADPAVAPAAADAAAATESSAADGEAEKPSDGCPAEVPAAAPAPSKGAAEASLHVLTPSEVEAGSEVERTVALIREELRASATDDLQVFAQALRRRLMEELGPIWHVVTGQLFVAEAAANARNLVVVTVGKLRIVCFQHEQFVGRTIDTQNLFKALPYLLGVIFCFAYMTLNTVCQEQAASTRSAMASWIHDRFCGENWQQDIGFIGACSLGVLFLSKKSNLFSRLFPSKPKTA